MDVCPSARLNPDLCPTAIWQSISPTPVLPGQLPDKRCARARNRYCGNINTPSQSCWHFFVWHFFVNLPCYSWWVVHVHIKRSDVTMVHRPKMLGKIISQVFNPWCLYYTVRVQIYLIDQQKILVVHRLRKVASYCTVTNPARCIIIHKNCGWALLPTLLFQGEA